MCTPSNWRVKSNHTRNFDLFITSSRSLQSLHTLLMLRSVHARLGHCKNICCVSLVLFFMRYHKIVVGTFKILDLPQQPLFGGGLGETKSKNLYWHLTKLKRSAGKASQPLFNMWALKNTIPIRSPAKAKPTATPLS